MIFLINNENDYIIKKNIDKIIKDNNIDEYNINKYSMTSDNLDLIIEDFQTYSMFDDSKIVIVEDALVFGSKKTDINVKQLENYFEDINKSTIVIFVLKDKLDERKKIVKKIREIGTIYGTEEINIKNIVKEFFGEYQISDDLIELLISRVGKDLNNLDTEVLKIKTYKDNDLLITKQDILNLSIKNQESDIFVLIDYIINKDTKNAIESYRILIKNNEEPIIIIIALANKLRMMYQIKEFIKKGYTEADIASILKVKPGYLYYLRKTISKYDTDDLINIINKLAELDYNIKTGTIDKYQAFELFLITNN